MFDLSIFQNIHFTHFTIVLHRKLHWLVIHPLLISCILLYITPDKTRQHNSLLGSPRLNTSRVAISRIFIISPAVFMQKWALVRVSSQEWDKNIQGVSKRSVISKFITFCVIALVPLSFQSKISQYSVINCPVSYRSPI